jgi:hypothetical protein
MRVTAIKVLLQSSPTAGVLSYFEPAKEPVKTRFSRHRKGIRTSEFRTRFSSCKRGGVEVCSPHERRKSLAAAKESAA